MGACVGRLPDEWVKESSANHLIPAISFAARAVAGSWHGHAATSRRDIDAALYVRAGTLAAEDSGWSPAARYSNRLGVVRGSDIDGNPGG